MTAIFSSQRQVQRWLDVESALARAQAEVGVLPAEEAYAIERVCSVDLIDLAALWENSRTVGYPILPLLQQVLARLPVNAPRIHHGATTQDIMDTALALDLRDVVDRFRELVRALGDALASLVQRHRHTVMAARTHGQQAVPTTFGAKAAVFVSELSRHLQRLREARPRVAVVSLHGAGGTSAALGDRAPEVRRVMGRLLDLGVPDVAWHVARDGVAEFGFLCGSLCATCARLAREVVDLSRTEVGEVREADGHHRGASSTMPQKANPISSEAVIGLAATASALVPALLRSMEAGHERAAGEWQIEWQVVPELACLAASALSMSADIAETLRVFPDVMRRNLDHQRGFVMAEAHMLALVPHLGRDRAHEVVYEACREAGANGLDLETALGSMLDPPVLEIVRAGWPLTPESYLGQAPAVCDSALADWQLAR